MLKPNEEQYQAIADKLSAKGFKPDTVFEVLKSSNFKVKLEGKAYNVYASRVIALMHNQSESSDALDLD